MAVVFSISDSSSKKNSWGSLFFWIFVVLIIRSLVFSPFKIPSGSMIPTLLVGDHLVTSKFSYGWSRFSFPLSGYFDYFSGRVGTMNPKRGDVVVFAFPNDLKTDYIKRIVGLPGDKIQMIEGVLYINDRKAELHQVEKGFQANDGVSDIEGIVYEQTLQGNDEEKPFKHMILKQQEFGAAELDNMPPVTLAPNTYFMMGDNRDGSGDSRVLDGLGPVDGKHFIGPALFIWISFSTDFSWFKPWLWPFQIRYGRMFDKIR